MYFLDTTEAIIYEEIHDCQALLLDHSTGLHNPNTYGDSYRT